MAAGEFGGLPIVSLQGGPLEGWNLVPAQPEASLLSAVALLLVLPVMLMSPGGEADQPRPGALPAGADGNGWSGLPITQVSHHAVDAEPRGRGWPARWTTGAPGGCVPPPDVARRAAAAVWPVLRGDMSLVGPRPERPVFIDQFRKTIPNYMARHCVKAGITGWAQVNGLGDRSIAEADQCDLYYIENWSLLLDLKILVRTALGGFLSRNAY
jgi:hypothetical protein